MDKKLIIKTGIFVSIVLILFVWGIGFIKNKNIFKSENTFYGIFSNVSGLTKSSVVYINGMKVGNVIDISFTKDNSGSIVVKFLVDDEVKLPKKSIAKITSLDLMGTKGIALLRTSGDEFHKNGDTLMTEIETDLKSQVNQELLPLKLKTEALIGSMDSVLIVVQAVFNKQTLNNLDRSFDNIRITLANLSSASFTLDTLMTSEKTKFSAIISNAESISQNIKNHNAEIGKILKNFSDISDSIAKADVANVIVEADKALADFNKILTKINKGEGSLGMLLHNDSLYINLENASLHLDELLFDLKENPKRYVRFSAFSFEKKDKKKDKKSEKE